MTARNWKWIVPAAAVPGLFVFAIIFKTLSQDLMPILVLFSCQVGLIALMCIMALAAVANFRNYFGWEELERFEARQRALNMTTAVMISENMKQMHPEAVKVLYRFGVKTVWQVRIGAKAGERDWILEGANVHWTFIEHMLDHSNSVTLMQKRLLSDKSYEWDPDGLMTDYEQYDAFLAWLISRMMATKAFGNLSAQWIPPWKPELVKEWMGLADEPQKLLKVEKA